MWLYEVIKKIYQDGEIKLLTCSEALKNYSPHSVVSLPEGSWGEGGHHWIWLNEWTEWTWRYIYDAEEEMEKIVQDSKLKIKKDKKLEDILKQAAIELMLLTSSDWQFLISTWSARDYAEIRVIEHYESFKKLISLAKRYIEKGELDGQDWNFINYIRERDKIFDEIDLNWFKKLEFP